MANYPDMESLKRTLITRWTWRRAFGGFIGIFVGIQSLMLKDPLLGLLSAYFLYQIITNTGCFGAGACSIPLNQHNIESAEQNKEI